MQSSPSRRPGDRERDVASDPSRRATGEALGPGKSPLIPTGPDPQVEGETHGDLDDGASASEPTTGPAFRDYVRSKTVLPYRCLTMDAGDRIVATGTGQLKSSTLQQQYGNVGLVKVTLPEKIRRPELAQLLKAGVDWDHAHYRLDLLDTGDPRLAWGVEEGAARGIAQVRADEWNEYARQGNFAEPVAGLEGTFAVRLAPMATPFRVLGGPPLQVNDGFGFIRESVAKTMGVTASGLAGPDATETTQRPDLDSAAKPNTQMLQWLKEDNALVSELVDHAIRNLTRELGARTRNNDALYRAATTGSFPVRYGTVIPVPGKNVVLSIDIGPDVRNVALHRSPADKPNWAKAPLEPANSALSQSVAQLTAFQYRLQQKPDPATQQPLLMMKGLLGVIPDASWPHEYAAQQLVGCVTDCKVDSRWNNEDEISAAKNAQEPRDLSLTGNLAVTQVMAPGSLVGVPGETMKKLSGDYDGDAVHVLSETDCPVLFAQLDGLDQRINPKLTKHVGVHGSPSTEDPASDDAPGGPGLAEPRSMADRLAEIRDAEPIVGIWSTIADQLCTVDPDLLETLVAEVSRIAKIPLGDVASLWEFVGLGIKVGTDLPKTNLSKLELRGVKLTADHLHATGKAVSRFLRDNGIDNPHRKKNRDVIAADLRDRRPMTVRDAMRPEHYGVPGRIMRAVNEYLRARQAGLAQEELTPHLGLQPGPMAAARSVLEESRENDAAKIHNIDDVTASVHRLIGALMNAFASHPTPEDRNHDMDRWLLRALAVVEPSALRQRLASAGGAGADADPDAAQRLFLDVVTSLEHEFTQFVAAGAAPPVDAAAPEERVLRPDDLGAMFSQPGPLPPHLAALVQERDGQPAAQQPRPTASQPGPRRDRPQRRGPRPTRAGGSRTPAPPAAQPAPQPATPEVMSMDDLLAKFANRREPGAS
jgi:hypothetical protein